MVSEVKFNGTKTYTKVSDHYMLASDNDTLFALWDDYTDADLKAIGFPGTVFRGIEPIKSVDETGKVHELGPGKMVVSAY